MNNIKVLAVLAVIALLTVNCGGGNSDGGDVQVSLTLNNIPAAATEMRLAVVFDGQEITENKTFTYNTPIGSTVVEAINLSAGAYDTYSLSAEVDLDMNGDGTEDGIQRIQIANAAFSDTMTTDIGHPASVTVNNIPATTTEMRFTIEYNGDGRSYYANFVSGAPVDLSIFATSNVVAGVYDTYSVSAVVDLDTDGDGTEDGCERFQQADTSYLNNMTIDFGTASPCSI